MEEKISASSNFIEDIINKDLSEGKVTTVKTRFPPEPNGCLHIGHAKSLCLNFGTARKYGGTCNLRFDDTNPLKEDEEFVNSIKRDIQWLGFKWDNLYNASDYFDVMYECAEKLIKEGKAYVCDLSAEEIRLSRGSLTEPGKESPYRDRSPEENLNLFRRMKAGEFADGEKVLRAKIDMASPNINMRDPVIYRVLHASHQNTGDKWCIYPMYDFAHPIEDAYEGITHSICTLEFEDHRPLYDWVTQNCGFPSPLPQQIEFARLNITNTIMSKRFLKRLVEDGFVDGWDDPRMPTLCGMRRRGYPPQAIIDFCDRIGVAKANSEVEYGYLNACVRDYLNQYAQRAMAVTSPIKVILTNLSAPEECEIENNPNKPEEGTRTITLTHELYIDGSDFSLAPPPKYHRLKLDGYVRLKGAYIIKCDKVETDNEGNILHLECSIVENSKSGCDQSGLKVKGVIQWVSAEYNTPLTLRKLDSLLLDGEGDFINRLNYESLKEIPALGEPSLASAPKESRFQFMRMGYYVRDLKSDLPVFNEIVGLKDTFNK
jgi:glutaminyl-tRNA synthetase